MCPNNAIWHFPSIKWHHTLDLSVFAVLNYKTCFHANWRKYIFNSSDTNEYLNYKKNFTNVGGFKQWFWFLIRIYIRINWMELPYLIANYSNCRYLSIIKGFWSYAKYVTIQKQYIYKRIQRNLCLDMTWSSTIPLVICDAI